MFVCNQCGHQQTQWTGQCSPCKQWNSMVPFKEAKLSKKGYSGIHYKQQDPIKLKDITQSLLDTQQV